jgi:hypothetical protein
MHGGLICASIIILGPDVMYEHVRRYVQYGTVLCGTVHTYRTSADIAGRHRMASSDRCVRKFCMMLQMESISASDRETSNDLGFDSGEMKPLTVRSTVQYLLYMYRLIC